MRFDRWRHIIPLRLRSILSGGEADRDLDDELSFHVERLTEANIAKGMTAADARTAALRAMGGIEQRKEECRDTRRVGWLVDLIRDLRYGARVLGRSPVFAAVAVLSLGIGIGANVAMFSVIDALLLKKLPVPNPDGLVHFTAVVEPPYRMNELMFEHYERLREISPSFSAMAAVRPVERSNVGVDHPANDSGSSATTRVALISDNYFSTLGIAAARGRTIGPEDNTERPIAVVSHAFWRARLKGDPDLTTHSLHLNGTAYDVVGVMPPGFSGEGVGAPVDFWVPLALTSKVVPELPQGASGMAWRVIARLAPGVSLEQATAAALVSFRQSDREGFASRGLKFDEAAAAARVSVELFDASRGVSPQRNAFRQSLLILMAGVALLLIVACANLANLLMARSSTRQRELAVRLAVGAGRGRIARQMLTESALIAGCGGLAGLAIASWATSILSSLMAAAPVSLNNDSMGLSLDLHIDPRVLVFATALSGLTAMLSGLAPARAAQRVPPASVLRANRTLGLDRLSGPSSWLLIAQVAVSLVLLVGAGLFAASVRNLRTLDIGIGRDRGLLVWTVPGQTGVRDDAMVELWQRIQERLSAVPGVAAVGASNQAILNGGLNGMDVPAVMMTVDGEPPKTTTRIAGRSFVTPGFFGAAGIRLLAGREFTEADRGSASYVAIINASMARFYFGTEAAAVGRMVRFPGPTKQAHQIVGVINDYVRTSPRNPQNYFSNYFPYRHPEAINRGQNSRLRVMLIAIRTSGAPLAIADAVRAEIRAIDPLLPILRINTVEQQLDDVLGQDRLVASLSTALGAMAMFLASIGLFGLLSYRVARRTNEIGVRLAFGATRSGVLRMILVESGRLVAAGLVVGVIAALSLARLVAARLYGVSPTDPWTIAGAIALLSIVAGVAALIPARRAATVDPATALRCD
jgi:predicted permease